MRLLIISSFYYC